MIKDDIDLSVCTALHSLMLDGDEPACTAILLFLSEVSSPHLRSLVIPFAAKSADNIPTFRPLSEPLASERFSRLAEVCFLYNGTPDRDLVLQQLHADLPELYARRLLRLVVDPNFRQPLVDFPSML